MRICLHLDSSYKMHLPPRPSLDLLLRYRNCGISEHILIPLDSVFLSTRQAVKFLEFTNSPTLFAQDVLSLWRAFNMVHD